MSAASSSSSASSPIRKKRIPSLKPVDEAEQADNAGGGGAIDRLDSFEVMTDADFEQAIEALRDEGNNEVGDLLKLMNENRIISWEEAERILGDSSQEPVKSSLPQQTRPTEPDNDTDVGLSTQRLAANDPKLVEINLNNMKRTPIPQVKRMLAALEQNTHLEKLSLANMGLYDMDVQTLIDVLEVNSTLRCVNLETNYLSGDFFARFFRAALSQQSLEEVKAVNQGVAFSTTSEREIIAAIFENRGLIKVSINLRLPEGRHKIEQAMIRNQEIRRILRRQLEQQKVARQTSQDAAGAAATDAKSTQNKKLPAASASRKASGSQSVGMAVYSSAPSTKRSSIVALGSVAGVDQSAAPPRSPTKVRTGAGGSVGFPANVTGVAGALSIAERSKKFASGGGGAAAAAPPVMTTTTTSSSGSGSSKKAAAAAASNKAPAGGEEGKSKNTKPIPSPPKESAATTTTTKASGPTAVTNSVGAAEPAKKKVLVKKKLSTASSSGGEGAKTEVAVEKKPGAVKAGGSAATPNSAATTKKESASAANKVEKVSSAAASSTTTTKAKPATTNVGKVPAPLPKLPASSSSTTTAAATLAGKPAMGSPRRKKFSETLQGMS